MVSVQGGQPIDRNTVLSIVSKHMKVVDHYAREEGSLEFSIENSLTMKEDFQKLIDDLRTYEMIAALRKVNEQGLTVTVRRIAVRKSRVETWLPIALFVVTVGVVMYDGLLRSQTMSARAYIADPWEMAIIYTLSLMGILGIHELGHVIASKKHKVKATWPFFLPGVPGFFINPPSFGAVIFSRGHMPNRDILFDIGIAGPIAGLIVTVLVSIYGAMLSPLIPVEEAMAMMDSPQPELFKIHSSLLMMATYSVSGKLVDGFIPVMSPIAFAAWVGFLLTFLNLLPAWQLDGGHITRAAMGLKWHRRMTFVSFLILVGLGFVLRFYGFIIMALFLMMMSSRSGDVKPLDDVSLLSRKRKMIFVVALFLAFLCAPLPFPVNF